MKTSSEKAIDGKLAIEIDNQQIILKKVMDFFKFSQDKICTFIIRYSKCANINQN